MMAILKAAGLHSESAFAHSLMNGMPPDVLSRNFSQYSHNSCMFAFSAPSVLSCCKLSLVRSFNGRRGCGSQRPMLQNRWSSIVLRVSADGTSKLFNGNGAALVEAAEGDILEISEGNLQTAEQGSTIVARRLAFDFESREGYENKDDYVIEENISREADDGSLNDTSAFDDEELSKASIHSKTMDITLASRAYEDAQKQLVQVSKTLDELYNFHTHYEKRPDLHADSQFSLQENVNEIKKLKLQMALLEHELDYKNETLQLVLKEANRANEQLRVLKEITSAEEKAHLGFEASDSLEFTPLDELLSKYMKHEDTQSELQETLASAENKASTLHCKVHHLQNHLVGWKMSLDLLEEEGKLSSQTLQIAAQELNYARVLIVKLTSKLHQQAQELEMNQAEIQAIEEELESTRKDLEVRSQLLSSAEVEASSQKELLLSLQETLQDEKEASTAALRSTAMQEKALQTAAKNISELTSQVATLKELLEKKEQYLTTMHEEAKRSANAMIVAAKNEEALVFAEKKINQLTAQVSVMEEEIRSRNLLLNEIKEDAVQTTEALKFATQIKQDLNLSKQREFELTQELESKTELVNELRQEIMENERATLAEQALRHAEKEMNELNAEVEVLRKGAHTRDEALKLMKDEIDRNIGVLSYAAENRESLQKMQLHIKELKAELRRRDALLKSKEKEQELGAKISSLHVESSNTNVQPPSAVLSSVSLEMPKPRKRSQRSTQASRKNTLSHDSSS